MAFTFTITAAKDVISIRLDGPLTLGPRLLDFGRQVTNLLATRQPRGLIFDVAAVNEIDSAGLGELVTLYTTAGQRGCRFCLLHPTGRTKRLLETTRLTGILPHFDDEPGARAWIAGE